MAEWDTPITRAQILEEASHPRPLAGRLPTIQEAIAAWVSAGNFSPSTAKAAHSHLESTRALGWLAHNGIVSIDQLTAARAAEYVTYLRDRGAAPATLRKVKTLFSSLATFSSAPRLLATGPGWWGRSCVGCGCRPWWRGSQGAHRGGVSAPDRRHRRQPPRPVDR
ncbi:MAG: hypothetical protein LC749_00095 [Actinobacteria bacterium]|nr:hypothetical protein [Actinomycetota bacterium]